jgi:RNA-directed DNA polymerase
VYVSEKSDINIVPEKVSNKALQTLQSSGDSGGKDDDQGEYIKRTTVTCTQRQGETLNGLARIHEAARKDKSLRFTSLMHHISEDLLQKAYCELRRDAATGVDNETWHEYGERLEERSTASPANP